MTNPLLSSTRVRAALRALDLHPTRGMGQNFLIDPEALAQIVEAGEVRTDDTVVEVGPGLGVLTWELVQRAGQVVAVELDRRLASRLEEEFGSTSHLRIVQGDILRLPPDEILGTATQDERRKTKDGSEGNEGRRTEDGSGDDEGRRTKDESQNHIAESSFSVSGLLPSVRCPSYKVIANLPYAITSPVLRHFLEASWQPEVMVVLVQWEVAQRIAAGPGDLSVLAHAIQFYAEPEVVAKVPPESFVPAPAVSSAILRLRVRPRPPVDVDNVDAFFRIIKAGFLQPRKKLSNALPGGLAAVGYRIERAVAVAALEAAGVSPERRAETVTLEEWARVYERLKGEG